MRIIGGRWRGRRLHFPDRPGLRPSPDRVRETLFNWLQADIAGSRCLDAFAGSGVLGLEAASRGASEVLLLELDAQAARAISDNLLQLAADCVKLQQRDTMAWLRSPRAAMQPAFDIVFIDPPFQAGVLQTCCELLEQGGWLAAQAKIYIECARDTVLQVPDNWCLLKHKTAGQVAYQLFARNGAE